MTELARSYGAGPLPLSEVARIEHLPLPYLEQLALVLRREGLIEATRGAHGGYELTRDPAAITAHQVVQAVDGDVAPVECLTAEYESGSCAREGHCASHPLWLRVQKAVVEVLSGTTLFDMVNDPSLTSGLTSSEGGN
jgi:Rrf2 family protein